MVGVCVVLATCVWGALRLAEPIERVLGHTEINIATRLMGLILAAIGVQFILPAVQNREFSLYYSREAERALLGREE